MAAEDKSKEEEKPEETESTKADRPPTSSSKKKEKNGLPWVIGFMALTNMVFVMNNPESKVQILGKGQIFLSILIWACSFVPGIRYVALIVMIPVWFRNFMVSGVPMLDRFSKGEPIFLGSKTGPDFDLKDVIPNYKDDLNPKA